MNKYVGGLAKVFNSVKSRLPRTKRNRKTISLLTLVHIAWRNLVSKKLRTFLTVFGIIIGIGAIFFLLSFGLGLRELVTKQVIGDKSIKSIDVSTPNSRVLNLDAPLINKLTGLPHVEKVGKAFSFPGSVSYNKSDTDAVVYGVDKNYEDLSSLNLSTGRLITNTDTFSIVVNSSLLRTVGITDNKSALNKKLDIKIPLSAKDPSLKEINQQFTIVGVIDSGSGGEIFMPAGVIEGAGVKYYSQVKIVADDTSSVVNLRKQIESLGYQTSSPIDTLAQINQIFKFFTIVLAGFGAIGMIVSVLGMFNTLTISLLERTKEIGLMMALGGRNNDMSKLFIFEAILLSIVGAVIGIIFAMLSGEIVNFAMNTSARTRGVTQNFDLFSTPLWLMGAMILFMVVVGILVAFFPSRRAAKINPIDALRRG
ncbi:MAG: ABC transporter permease [Patescibacteria group bacterium]